MIDLIASDAALAFVQVVTIDLILAGDNAIVIGIAAAGLPAAQRRRAIMVGILAATALRLAFAAVAMQLLQVLGLLLAGGLLLLWVCWKMWRQLRAESMAAQASAQMQDDARSGRGGGAIGRPQGKSFGQAILNIVLADLTMSLDNVLAVAGAAREHPWVLALGLLLSIALMGAAAGLLARLLETHRWIAYGGLAVIFYVACEMIYRGAQELQPVFQAAAAAMG